MVRRVGFGDEGAKPTEEPPKKSVADQAMDRFRRRAKNKRAREAEGKKTNRSKARSLIFLVLWLILWVAMSGGIIYTMASEGLNTNVVPLVIWTAASVFVVSKVITRIVKIATSRPNQEDRPDNF